VDIDPQALQATSDNAETNQVAGNISVFEPGGLPAGQVDVLVANILAGPLLALAPSLASRLRPGGLLAISGLLARHTAELEACYQQWFDLEPALKQEDWVLLHGQRLRDKRLRGKRLSGKRLSGQI
jgi:ribosomal protein L11 methyltransferase